MDRGPGPSFAALCFATTGTAQALGPAGTTPVGVVAARILVGGRLPASVHEALERLQAACAGADPPWSAINEAHADLHAALVRDPRKRRPTGSARAPALGGRDARLRGTTGRVTE